LFGINKGFDIWLILEFARLRSSATQLMCHCGDQLIFLMEKEPFKTGDFTNPLFSMGENGVTKEAPLFVGFPIEKNAPCKNLLF
jgi:hypothetical protein